MTQLDSSTLIAEGGDHIGRRITASRTGPWWLHMDLDVLDEEALPAVTYPQPAGSGWDDLTALLAVLGTDHRLMGVTVADFRPDLDTHSRYARRIIDMLAATLARQPRQLHVAVLRDGGVIGRPC